MKILSFRAAEEDIVRWKDEAKAAGISFGAWARQRLNGPIAPKLASVAKGPIEGSHPDYSKSKCEHRIPPGAYCKSCGKIKK